MEQGSGCAAPERRLRAGPFNWQLNVERSWRGTVRWALNTPSPHERSPQSKKKGKQLHPRTPCERTTSGP
eukprot:2182089-Prymnesium_polylepis.1